MGPNIPPSISSPSLSFPDIEENLSCNAFLNSVNLHLHRNSHRKQERRIGLFS